MFNDKKLRELSLLGDYSYLIFFIYIINFMNLFTNMLSIDLYYLFMGISIFFEVLIVLLIVIQIIRINTILKDKNLRIFMYSLLVFIIVIPFRGAISEFSSLLMNINFGLYGTFGIYYVVFFHIFYCVIIFGIFFYVAWYNLEKFFDKNKNSFPNAVAQDAVLAINNFKKATVLYIFIILILPAIVGIFLFAKGCLKLGEALKKL